MALAKSSGEGTFPKDWKQVDGPNGSDQLWGTIVIVGGLGGFGSCATLNDLERLSTKELMVLRTALGSGSKR